MGDQNKWSNPTVTFRKKSGNGGFVMNMVSSSMDIFWQGTRSPKPFFKEPNPV